MGDEKKTRSQLVAELNRARRRLDRLRKAAAAKRRSVGKKLRENRELSHLISDNVDDMIAVLDLKGRRLYNNPAYRMLGDPDSLRGSDSFREIHPEDQGKVRRVFEETVRTGVGGRAEYRFVLADGSMRYIESQGNAICDKDGKPAKIIVVSRDITERRELEAKSQALQQQLFHSEKLKALGECLSGIAHELNNPLGGILTRCQLILQYENIPLSDRLREDFEMIFQEALRCKKIVKNVAAFSRKHASEKTSISVNGIIEDCLRLQIHRLRDGTAEVRNELDPELPETLADYHQLQQVFLNLINNALQAAEGRRRKTTLIIRTRRTPSGIRVEFEDNGPGIPPERLSKVFEPFFTTKEVGEGTGLGLSISHGIVTEHGGRIWAESAPGKGATFVIELPVRTTPKEDGTAKPSGDDACPSGRRVLVIDDEASIRKSLERYLQSKRMEPETAPDGRTALRMLNDKDYDAVLCDIHLPGIDGRKLYAWAKRHRPDLASRWVFLTGSVDRNGKLPPKGAKPTHLHKPFRLEEIAKALNDL
ncbi:MAG: ATP-binding protein [Elusimicrobiota bacterium]